MTVRTSVDETELHLLGQPGAGVDSSLLRGNGRSYVSSIFRHTFDLLRPDILTRRKGPAKPIGPTAWLDGLRGWAAFNVAIVHLTVYTHEWAELCYGIELLPNYYLTSPIVWPFIRLIFSGGHFAVMLFFHISGYVLTRRLVSMMHEGPSRHDEVVDAVHSAIVRRPFRLFLPVVWSTLTWAIIWHVTGIAIPWPAKQSNIITELGFWIVETLRFFHPFRGGYLFTLYNVHTWTIPVELRGSLLVYLWCFVTYRFATRVRILATLTMTLYFNIGATGSWYAGFMAGMLTGEIDLLAGTRVGLPWEGLFAFLRRHRFMKGLLLHLMLVVGLYLASIPTSDNEKKDELLGKCRGWKTLRYVVPWIYNDKGGESDHRWFFLFWGAWLTIVGVKEIWWVRKLFESGPAQYLGKISFALYLVHGPMLGMVSERLFYITGVKSARDKDQKAHFGHLYRTWPLPGGQPEDLGWGKTYGLEPNFLFCAGVSLVVFLYVAEIGTKMWDGPSVKVAKWVYRKLKSKT